jgi:uncharacterized membrane protein (Fun14 family)
MWLLYLAAVTALAILAGIAFGFALGFAIRLALKALILLVIVAACLWVGRWLLDFFHR